MTICSEQDKETMFAFNQETLRLLWIKLWGRFEYREAAIQLGRHLASSGIALVYGGARVGLMGALADSVLAGGGQAIGVMPQSLVEKEIAHTALTKLHIVESMHERKALMADLADAFVLLPGGFGSWEEFCEVVTWLQLGLHQKPRGEG